MLTKKGRDFQSVMHLTENNDAFNFTNKAVPDLKQAILNFVHQPTFADDQNKSFGIYGKWGTGKTTLIKNVFEQIELENDQFMIVKIDLWKFELYPNDLEIITQEIVSKIFRYRKPLKLIKKIAKGILQTVVSLPNVNNWMQLMANQMNHFFKTEEDLNPSKQLKKLKKELKNKKVLIVFDDLDRCSDNKIELYLNYIKHVIASLSSQIKTVIVLDYQYVKDILFKDQEKAINFFKKLIYKNFRIEEYLDHTISKESLDSWMDPHLAKKLPLVFETPRDRKILLDKTNEIYELLMSESLIKESWIEILHYFIFFLVCLNNDLEEYSNKKILRFMQEDLEEQELVIKGISKVLNNYMGNNFANLNTWIPLNFEQNWKNTLFKKTIEILNKKILLTSTGFALNETELKLQINKLKFKKNSYLLVNNGNKIDILNFYFGGFSYADETSYNVFSKTNDFLDYDILAKKNQTAFYLLQSKTHMHSGSKHLIENFENFFEVNKENRFLFNKENQFKLLLKVQKYFDDNKIDHNLITKYSFLVKKINLLCLDLIHPYWNFDDWEELKKLISYMTKYL